MAPAQGGAGRLIYNLFFRKNYMMLGTVFATGWVFEIAYNQTMNKIWDRMNAGRQWKDIRHKYYEGDDE